MKSSFLCYGELHGQAEHPQQSKLSARSHLYGIITLASTSAAYGTLKKGGFTKASTDGYLTTSRQYFSACDTLPSMQDSVSVCIRK